VHVDCIVVHATPRFQPHRSVQVVRCFEDDSVVHVVGKVDPVEDTDTINFELALADVAQIEKRQARLNKGTNRSGKTVEEKAKEEVERGALELIVKALDEGKAARAAGLDADQREAVRGLQLLTMKPLTYAANVSEDELGDASANAHVQVRPRCLLCERGDMLEAKQF
jgi:obg-like ATPase 1